MALNKYELNTENINACVDWAKISGYDFELILSNYTAKIDCKQNAALNIQFIKEEKPFYFFAMFKELKKQVETYLLNNTILLPNEVRYYDVIQKKDFYKKEIFNIDLSSAYINVLFNEKIIDKELFNKLEKLPKLDRLGVVGMLASKKNVYYYKNGELQDVEIIENKILSDVFYFCVVKTFLIMQDLKNIIYSSFIFSWVDGIYFDDKTKIKQCEDYLIKNNYPYKIENLNNFIYTRVDENAVIEYLKEGKTKRFSLPIQKGTFLNDYYNKLNNDLK
jgi:hypothetical protein